MNDNETAIRRYLLAPNYALRGWKLLPYAVQRLDRRQTEFFLKEQWELFSSCDGRTDINRDALTDEQRNSYDHWEENGFIRRAGNGVHDHTDEGLLPVQRYRFYPARFKERVQWSITGRCNYKCRHCFMYATTPRITRQRICTPANTTGAAGKRKWTRCSKV